MIVRPRVCHVTRMKWPATPTDDLRHRLEAVLSWRSFGPVEVYAVFSEWCEEHGVEPPKEQKANKTDVSTTMYENLWRPTQD